MGIRGAVVSRWSTMWHFGGELVDNWSDPQAFTGDTEEVRRALRVYQELVRAGAMSPPGTFGTSGTGGTSINVVGYGLSAMGLANSLYMQTAIPYGIEFKTNWSIASLPSGPWQAMTSVKIPSVGHWSEVQVIPKKRSTSCGTSKRSHGHGVGSSHRRKRCCRIVRPCSGLGLRYNTIPSNCCVLLDTAHIAAVAHDRGLLQSTVAGGYSYSVTRSQRSKLLRTIESALSAALRPIEPGSKT